MSKKNPILLGPGRWARIRRAILAASLGLLFYESHPAWAEVTAVTLTTLARSADNTVAELTIILVDVALISGVSFMGF